MSRRDVPTPQTDNLLFHEGIEVPSVAVTLLRKLERDLYYALQLNRYKPCRKTKHVAIEGPTLPRNYGSWCTEICTVCGWWREHTHPVTALRALKPSVEHYGKWQHPKELKQRLEEKEDDERF